VANSSLVMILMARSIFPAWSIFPVQKPLSCCRCSPFLFQLLNKDGANGGISAPGKMSGLHPAIILDGSRNKGHKGSGSSGSFLDFETSLISSAFSFLNKAHNLVNLAPANGFVPMYSFCLKINGIKLVPDHARPATKLCGPLIKYLALTRNG
jgi:hypothetical protein